MTTKSDILTLSNGMEFMRVPAGKFLMGSNDDFDKEKPLHTVDIPYDYWMARFPVTNKQYNAYIEAKGGNHPVSGWKKKEDHPVTFVKWTDAMEYCQWLNELFKSELPESFVLHLPTEAEWEKAARGTDGRVYPWGNVFDKDKCNARDSGIDATTSVDQYSPKGDSPYGCADMVGNVSEWTHSLMKKYPYKAKDGRENENGTDRVERGHHFGDYGTNMPCARRGDIIISNSCNSRGFRVAASPKLSEKINIFAKLFSSKKKQPSEQVKPNEPKKESPLTVFEISKINDISAMQTYINSGGDVNAKNNNGLTALMIAAMNSCYDIAKLLIDAGADVNTQSDDGLTALMAATSRGFTKMMKLLIEANADLELKEKANGFTALTGAIVTSHIDAVKLLIEAGADVNSKANFERTALMAASARGEIDMVKLLIDAKADVNAKETQAGFTALIGAERNGHSDVVKMLKKARAKG
jgi:formylglycine-generating enzyme required for sulfatase activity